MSATTPADRIDATTSLPHARAHRAATVVREVFWRSLSPLAKFTALGLGYRRTTSLNDDPAFIATLADVIVAADRAG